MEEMAEDMVNALVDDESDEEDEDGLLQMMAARQTRGQGQGQEEGLTLPLLYVSRNAEDAYCFGDSRAA